MSPHSYIYTQQDRDVYLHPVCCALPLPECGGTCWRSLCGEPPGGAQSLATALTLLKCGTGFATTHKRSRSELPPSPQRGFKAVRQDESSSSLTESRPSGSGHLPRLMHGKMSWELHCAHTHTHTHIVRTPNHVVYTVAGVLQWRKEFKPFRITARRFKN